MGFLHKFAVAASGQNIVFLRYPGKGKLRMCFGRNGTRYSTALVMSRQNSDTVLEQGILIDGGFADTNVQWWGDMEWNNHSLCVSFEGCNLNDALVIGLMVDDE